MYKHSDMHHLEQLLQLCPPSKRMLVITDSLFSMDGDFADLPALVALRRRYGFLLAIDEAHATLVAGDRSASCCCGALLTCWSCSWEQCMLSIDRAHAVLLPGDE